MLKPRLDIKTKVGDTGIGEKLKNSTLTLGELLTLAQEAESLSTLKAVLIKFIELEIKKNARN